MQPDFGPTTQQFDSAVSREALPVGSRVGGYQIVDVLGGGGFGIVYLALDLSLQRQVAIKEYLPTDLATRGPTLKIGLRPGADADAYAAGLSAFLNEAKQLARFDHPSLVRVYSFWEENGTAYMVMPFYPGHTLAVELRTLPQPPDEAWLRALLAPLLSVLSTLHAASTWHRDISPENILLQPDGRPVLLDFGAASRAARDKTVPLTALLNPAFAPIEQYSESPQLRQGPWTDLYALASVVYLSIVGKPPMSATVRAVDDRQPPLAEVIRPLLLAFPETRYSAGFLAAIDKALSVHPKDRPQNVAEFQAALDRPLAAATPRSAEEQEQHDEVSAAIATALRSVPGQPRAEPAFRMPDFTAGDFDSGPSSSTVPGRRGSSGGRRMLAWLLVLGAGALVAAGGWQWSRTEQGRQMLETLTGEEREPPRVFTPVGAPSPVAAASAVILPVTQAQAAPSEAVVAAERPEPPAAAVSTPQEAPPAAVKAEAPAAPPPAPAPATPAPTAGKAVAQATEKTQQTPPKPAPKTQDAPAAEPNNPRAMCGGRANFALFYCMQTQCNRPRFAQHAQCVDLRRRGEVN
jgi:serine/threonine protein kinase